MTILGATLCTSTAHSDANFPKSLLVPSCSAAGFSITVDETCRAAEYNFIDWKSSTFVDGNSYGLKSSATYDVFFKKKIDKLRKRF